MKPWTTLATARAPDGTVWTLSERDGVFAIRVGGHELMSSARHGSEEAMAAAGLGGLSQLAPRVLIGGLGMGYTLRAALERLPAEASVQVAELSGAVIAWNLGPLGPLAGHPLRDPRVRVEPGDVARLLGSAPARRFHAILLDVDNGPSGLAQKDNQRLYGAEGLRVFHRSLAPGGTLVVWSAGPDDSFLRRLQQVGFEAEAKTVKAHARAPTRHTLFVART
ncbi:MAG TPA: hypothetical protein VEY30_03695 [Myxococcaceae bacterium]|nr:hypothetical protein [Myxococcaceae bacterium]